MAQGLEPSVANWVGFLLATILSARNSRPQTSNTRFRAALRYFSAEITSELRRAP